MRDEDKELFRLLGAGVDAIRDLNETIKSRFGTLHVVIDNPTSPPPPPSTATSARLTFNGEAMANLTVDSVGKARVNFDDDKGDTDAPEPTGTTIAWSSTGQATLAQDPNDPLAADVGNVVEGDSGTFVAAFNGTALKADGTAIDDPAPFAYGPVTAGQAVSASLSES